MSKLGDLIYNLLNGGSHEAQQKAMSEQVERERRNADEASRGQALLEQKRAEAEALHARARRTKGR